MPTGLQKFSKGISLFKNGEDLGNLNSTKILDTVITLQVDKIYRGIHVGSHCLRGALVEVVYNNNGTETVKLVSGNDSYNSSVEKNIKEFILDTSGLSGPQELFIRYKNFSKASTVRAEIGTTEFNS